MNGTNRQKRSMGDAGSTGKGGSTRGRVSGSASAISRAGWVAEGRSGTDGSISVALCRVCRDPINHTNKKPPFTPRKQGLFDFIAADRNRTCTSCGHKNLNLARLPIPPRPREAGASYSPQSVTSSDPPSLPRCSGGSERNWRLPASGCREGYSGGRSHVHPTLARTIQPPSISIPAPLEVP